MFPVNEGSRPPSVFPPCFKDWEHWVAFYRVCKRSGMKNPYRQFCFDCTPNNQRDMIDHGRCIRPEIRFFMMDEGTEREQVAGLFDSQIQMFTSLKRIDPNAEIMPDPLPELE